MRWLPSLLRQAGVTALGLLYPPHCAQCQAETAPGSHLCERCASEAPVLRAPFCQRCAEPFFGTVTTHFECSNCAGRRFHFRCAVAPYRARGVVREFIHRFKYEKHFYLRHTLAEWLAAGLHDERLQAPPVDLLIPVPLHPARQRAREFNQAEVLARLITARAAAPVETTLRRTRNTSTQVRLSRDQRLENLRGAFCVAKPSRVEGKHLLVIDDVMTTGSTVEECSRVLHAAGAASVRVLTVARA